nr:hypothetical protein [Bradyrhizobium uaiense]
MDAGDRQDDCLTNGQSLPARQALNCAAMALIQNYRRLAPPEWLAYLFGCLHARYADIAQLVVVEFAEHAAVMRAIAPDRHGPPRHGEQIDDADVVALHAMVDDFLPDERIGHRHDAPYGVTAQDSAGATFMGAEWRDTPP